MVKGYRTRIVNYLSEVYLNTDLVNPIEAHALLLDNLPHEVGSYRSTVHCLNRAGFIKHGEQYVRRKTIGDYLYQPPHQE